MCVGARILCPAPQGRLLRPEMTARSSGGGARGVRDCVSFFCVGLYRVIRGKSRFGHYLLILERVMMFMIVLILEKYYKLKDDI